MHIYEFRLDQFENPTGDFVVRCTKGTYVRTLCADVGKALGCGAHLAKLHRTESGQFKDADAIPLGPLMEKTHAELESLVLPISQFAQPRRG